MDETGCVNERRVLTGPSSVILASIWMYEGCHDVITTRVQHRPMSLGYERGWRQIWTVQHRWFLH